MWREPGNVHGFLLSIRMGHCKNGNWARRFWCGDINIKFMRAQLHYYRVRQMEPCHQLGWISQTLFLSNWTLGAIRKQKKTRHAEYQYVCSTLRYSWVTCVIFSNFCNFSQLDLSTHPLLLYHCLPNYQTSVVLSKLCHLYTPCYLFTCYVIYSPYKCTCCTHRTHTTLTLVLSCARSLRQYTILTHQTPFVIVPFWFGGIETWLGVFTKNNLLPSRPIRGLFS